jgi:beta-N-acetylhexosaminidase
VKLSFEQAVGQKLLLAFPSKGSLSDEIVQAIRKYQPGGVTLFRSLNIEDPAQVRHLTEELQAAARRAALPPLLIAADQEGGQLMAIGQGATPLPGNMALGATGSSELSRRAGQVLGRELAAMGINVNYAPSCDVNVNPNNPVIGVRSFGEDPGAVARLAAAMVEGIQSAGVAATAKHFPGHGDTASDSHLGLPSLPHSLDRLREVELPPFESAIRAGTKMVMTAHLALPALDGPQAPPATLSPSILKGLLRGQLGFQGVIVTDAMDMGAIAQGKALGENAVRAAQAGADLALITSSPADQELVHSSLRRAASEGSLDADELNNSVRRILALKHWLADQSPAPDLSLVGCTDHQVVADEIAARSVTLVRDQAGLLPLRLGSGGRAAVVIPKPVDLTPADTSSYVTPALTPAFRKLQPDVDEFIVAHSPTEQEIGYVLERASNYNVIVVGTLNAFKEPHQHALVQELIRRDIPTVVVAMRLPYDLSAFPQAPTFVCTYSILEPSMRALASCLFGINKFQGRLPVSIPGLYPVGHGETL